MSVTRSRRRLAASLAAAVTVSLAAVLPVGAAAAADPDPDLAPLGTITASVFQDDQDGRFPGENAIDGDAGTRWASGNGPDDADAVFTADLTADLGQVATVSEVGLAWEEAYAVGYHVEVATADPDEASSWTAVFSETAGDGGDDAITLDSPVQARYVRLTMTERVAVHVGRADAPLLRLLAVHAGRARHLRHPAGRARGIAQRRRRARPRACRCGCRTPPTTDQTVRVVTGGGTAEPGTDYTPVDQVVTFPAGETEQSVDVATFSRGPLAPRRTVDLTLSEPSSGIELGARTTTTVTITPTGDLPETNDAHGPPRLLRRRAGRLLRVGLPRRGHPRAVDHDRRRRTGIGDRQPGARRRHRGHPDGRRLVRLQQRHPGPTGATTTASSSTPAAPARATSCASSSRAAGSCSRRPDSTTPPAGGW